MRRRTLVAGALASVLLFAVGPARVAGALQELLDAEHAAGMPGVFAEVRNGHQVWLGAAGAADVDTGSPPQPTFEQRVGSITKTFVATTVLQLVGEGRLRLDDPIGRHLPDIVWGATGQQVTVRMLLNHTGGIANYLRLVLRTREDLRRYQHETVTPYQLAAVVLAALATNAPGAAWSYSNTNYVLLGLLIERVTGAGGWRGDHPAADRAVRLVSEVLSRHELVLPRTARQGVPALDRRTAARLQRVRHVGGVDGR